MSDFSKAHEAINALRDICEKYEECEQCPLNAKREDRGGCIIAKAGGMPTLYMRFVANNYKEIFELLP